MSWTRAHLETMTELQLRIQCLVEEAGINSVGADGLVEANEALVEAHAYALLEVEKAEQRKADALHFAEALRPYAVSEGRTKVP